MSTVNGPTSSTDNSVTRWDGTSGNTVQDSGVIIDNSNNVSGMETLTLPHNGLRLHHNYIGTDYALIIDNNMHQTADCVLTLDTDGANASLKIVGSKTLTQDLTAVSDVTFNSLQTTYQLVTLDRLSIPGIAGVHLLDLKAGSSLTANRTLTFVTGDADRTLTINGDVTLSGSSSGTNTGDQNITGTTNRIAVTNGNSTTPIIDISSTYAGQTSISTLGTVTTGTWHGAVIDNTHGGAGSISGILKANGSGVVSAAVASTDYAPATSGTSVLKGNGVGGFANAVPSTDFAPATSGTAILKGNNAGGFTNAVSSTDYAPATAGTALLKGNGTGGFSNAVAGTDYLAPNGNGSALTNITATQVSYDPSTSGQATTVNTVQKGIDATFATIPSMNVLCPHRNLVLKCANGPTVSLSAASLVLFNAAGYARKFDTFSITLNVTTSGAGGLDTGSVSASHWYYIWAIAKADGTKSAIFSLSSTAPTLPSGYVFYGLVGADYYNAGSSFLAMLQRGTEVSSGLSTFSISSGTVNMSAFVPSIATRVYLNVKPATGQTVVLSSNATDSWSDVTVYSPNNVIIDTTNVYIVTGTTAGTPVISGNGWSYQ